MQVNKITPRILAVVIVLAATPTLAQAYIDPGNGAYMVQVLFTLVGAALFYVTHPIQSLRALARWIRRSPGKVEMQTAHDSPNAGATTPLDLDASRASVRPDEST